MIEFNNPWLTLLFDVSLKSLVLAAAAGAALTILRVRNNHIRHRAWTSVLVGMLVFPALLQLTPRVPLIGWPVAAGTPNAASHSNPISTATPAADGNPAGNRHEDFEAHEANTALPTADSIANNSSSIRTNVPISPESNGPA
jgi:hypothetical protein